METFNFIFNNSNCQHQELKTAYKCYTENENVKALGKEYRQFFVNNLYIILDFHPN